MNIKFEELFDQKMEQEYFSPGRINLIGEHIDYNGGTVFPMSINLGTYGYLNMRNDSKIRLYSLNFEEVGIIEANIDEIAYDERYNWGNYVLGVIDVFQKAGYKITNGFNLLVNGTIPNGSGLSSSASLEVLIGRILIDNFKLDINDVDLALYAQKAENKFMGVNCGIMDQFIIANGTDKGALSINTDSLDYNVVEFDLKDNIIVVLNSNKKRGLVDSEYNQRRQSCENVLKISKEKYDVNNLCDLSVQQLDTLVLDKEDYNRALHAITEQDRVIKSINSLTSGNINDFGSILYEGHSSLKDLFEVSCKELDFIVDSCKELGFIGARMTGAGFGGCCIALINKNETDKLEVLKEQYEKEFELELEYYLVYANDKTKKIN